MIDFKVKVWDKNRKKMGQLFGFYEGNQGRYRIIIKFGNEIQDKLYIKSKFVFLKFTGFTSEDGTDVYEGDILCRTENHGPYNNQVRVAKGIVYWDDIKNGFFVLKDDGEICYLKDYEFLFVAVNIYEKPDYWDKEINAG